MDRQALFDRYELVDWALKVVGVGSVGLVAAVVLLDEGGGVDPVFLQVKQAEASVLERFLGASGYATTASGWSPASASSRRRPTSSSAGPSGRPDATSTSASSRTRRAARSSRR